MKPFLYLLTAFCLWGSASFAQHAIFDSVVSSYISCELDKITVGDINNDGRSDILAAKYDSLAIWLQQPGGTLAAPIKLQATDPFANAVTGLLVTDLDSDGTSNIIVGTYYNIKIYEWYSSALFLTDSVNIGAGDFAGITVNDFDSDGYTDIAFLNAANSFIEVMFHNNELGNRWDIHHYDIGATSYNQIISGVFGGLTKPALVHQGTDMGVSVLTFTTTRTLDQHYSLDLIPPFRTRPNSIAVVNKGAGNTNELWATYGGNSPSSKLAIWRGLQTIPDTVFDVYEVPEAIQSANLDCDDNDEQVILHGGWLRATVFTDTAAAAYPIPYVVHTYNSAMVLGDVNNDGLKDICFLHDNNYLAIMYNITSACPSTTGIPITGFVDDELSVYPNPTNGEIEVTYKGRGILLLTDVQGRIVQQKDFKQKATIDLSNQTAGLYLLKLQTEDGLLLTQKLIKQ